jgi:tRNA pseudouridine38-40 synthase
MRLAAQILVGEHDFSAFRASECQAVSPVRHLTRLDITRRGDVILFEVRANAFLHHMVRNIIGCLVYVGKGKYPPEWIKALLEGRTRAAAAPTFSPAGLYLAGVRYDVKWNVPSFLDIPHEPAPVAVLPYFRGRTVCG